MRQTLTLSLTSLILWAIVTELNHWLTGIQVTVFAGVLFVAFGALTLPLRSGLTVSIIGGMICDANAPVQFGTHVLLFVITHLIIFHIRDRVPRQDYVAAIIFALLTNLGLFLVFSFTQIFGSTAPAAIWPRLLVDLFCSQLLIALVTPWFFALQARALDIAGGLRRETA